jgi:ABC-type bacteriocin/lantibiotic exporter with double-glycine peptidase domain
MNLLKMLNGQERKLLSLAVIRSILSILLEIAALIIFIILISFLVSINGGAELSGFRSTILKFVSLNSTSVSSTTGILISEITAIYLVKNLVGYSNVLFLHKIIGKIQNRIAENLYLKFFRLPFIKINSIGTTEASASLVDSINHAIAGRISFLILGLVEILNIMTILVVLSTQNVQITFALVLFCLSLLIFTYHRLRHKASKNGTDLYRSTISSRLYFAQGKESISIFTLSGRIPFFLENLNEERRKFTDAYLNGISLQQLPKYVIESYLLLSLFFLYLATQLLKSTESSTLFLLLFVLSGIRILPSITRLQTLWLGHSDSKHRVDIFQKIYTQVNQEKSDLESLESHKISMPPNLRIERIIAHELNFFHGEKQIIRNLNFEIVSGRSTLIRGASGSGKTTLLNLIAGLLQPKSGSIKYHLSDGSVFDASSLPFCIGYVPQQPIIFKGSLARNILLENRLDEISLMRLLEIMRIVDKGAFFSQKDWGIDSIEAGGSNLSGGEKQRINIGRAIALNSNVLIMDEPTNSLDSESAIAIIKEINEHSKSKNRVTISTTHQDELHGLFQQTINL